MMYTVNQQIENQEYNQLQLQKLVKTEALEILSISLEKDAVFPEHTSPKDAQLIVLEGEVVFHINNRSFSIGRQQHFSFPKEEPHWVSAVQNSKFLIIR